jgi:uncharacterized membrane protein
MFTNNKMKKIFIPQIVVILMLLFALNPANPYGYYILLRWVCFAGFGYLAVQAVIRQKIGWIFVLALIAILFNPIVRIFHSREAWIILDLLTIPVAIGSIFGLEIKKK